MKQIYYKTISSEGNEFIIKRIYTDDSKWFPHYNALILSANENSTGGWWRKFTDKEFDEFEALDDAEFELQQAMSNHMVN